MTSTSISGRHCIIIQHLLFEDLGIFESILTDAGFTLEYFQAGVALPSQSSWLDADLAIILGGPIGVNDSGEYPFITDELMLTKARIDHGSPLLGICLGAQLIARALGSSIIAGNQKEIGWGHIALSEAGQQSALRHLNATQILHWHGETFSLPQGATLLASTDITAHQAFSAGKGTLALQFHPEANANKIEQWLIGHTCELSDAGIKPSAIRAQVAALGETHTRSCQKMFTAWLEQVNLLHE